ncbi:cation channel sperm-associated protein 1-like [Actinia tenebrosa]|uniref:Cation channel sperm-associated protein 1-like n=1 Tax=Actinia tenebrosa TaxID=6105 RepID=A0A6P8HGH1_ACTTE|nr:cation channel sperm-associated protein 1-like [Actinia tenebrosa]
MTKHHTLPKTLENAGEFRLFIYELTESKMFGGAILVVILLNTVILVTQTDEAISVKAGWYFSSLDNVFLAIYFVEIVLKLYALRSAFFSSGWNIMDGLIVLFTTIDFLLPLIVQNVSSFDVAAIFRLLRMFRAIRALRALRVLRTIRFLKNLQVIMTTVLKSFRALSTIVMLQSLFLYMFAVIGRGLFYEISPSRFGNLGKAFFTLFQLITLDDWFYMYSDVVKIDPGYGYIILYLIIYIVLENFIFMNLFVAVLVDNFQRTLAALEEKGHKKSGVQIRSVFAGDEIGNEDVESFESSFSEESDDDIDVQEELEEEAHWKPKKVEDFYHADKFPDNRMRESMSQFFMLLTSLEYNMQHMQRSQATADDLIDITVTVPDVPEELL